MYTLNLMDIAKLSYIYIVSVYNLIALPTLFSALCVSKYFDPCLTNQLHSISF